MTTVIETPPPAVTSTQPLWYVSDQKLDAHVPGGALERKWDTCKADMKLVAPHNRRKHTIIVVGTGLAGGAAAAVLGEQGYHVLNFCYQDSPRRAHSIAAQGGINAAKNYRNDGDSVWRLFMDTVKGGDYRSREATVYRLAQLSIDIIDQCVASGVPFAREYSGYLDTRSFGGAQVARTFYARGQTGQQLLLGVYSSLVRQMDRGTVESFPRHEMLDLILVDGVARGVLARDLVTGEIKSYAADAVVLCTGGYGNVFFLSTYARGANATAIWRAHKRGALFANPCFTQIHPTCIPVKGDYQSKLTLISESVRNDGRVWVPKKVGDNRPPNEIPEEDRDYYLERMYPSYGNLAPRDISSRAAKRVCDEGRGVGPGGYGVYLDLRDAINRLGKHVIEERYGNLMEMYEQITDENPYEVPLRIYPATHYTMGGLWVDYKLMSNVPGLFVGGEANYSDHGANRLGASALLQGLADGYWVLPATLPDYIATAKPEPITPQDLPFAEAENEIHAKIRRLLSINGSKSVATFHRELGQIMWNYVGMARSEESLVAALGKIRSLREEYWRDVRVTGGPEELNQQLEHALRVADFLELAELMALDALARDESCGAHFRVEHQTAEGEAERDDEHFAYVAAWGYNGSEPPILVKEPLVYENVKLAVRSYK